MADLRPFIDTKVVQPKSENEPLILQVPKASVVTVITAGRDYEGYRLQQIISFDDNLPEEVAYSMYTLAKGAIVAMEERQDVLRRIAIEALRKERETEEVITRKTDLETVYPRGTA